ncbi:TolC family protein [Niabella drilacis]|uniref:Outer membrane protein TolC n=1 Tax=Niabella drilacis (strain DSM 25811 / CCM 8410 / CCUG 62505 / LMG 26954 / E90) TaxID=1285928 RepID=A0A1G6LA78_NIADE|nr:TolC family protein [Niabella drilacis]SDC39947.1 Outer membrane protein TolC [Niabella drilacis]
MKWWTSCLILLLPLWSPGQSLSLDDCYQLARENFPVIKKQDLLRQSTRYSIENTTRSWLPQLSVSGQATYQTDVTKIPVAMPGVPELSKDQYRIQGEVTQALYDGGVAKTQKALLKTGEALQLQQIEISFQSVKERVTQLFFSILLLDAQLQQQEIYKNNIVSSLEKTKAAAQNGTAAPVSVTELKAELIKADMGTAEMISDQHAIRETLALFIGAPVPARLVPPDPPGPDTAIRRPELGLFDLQKKNVTLQEKALTTGWAPRIAAFMQAGYGRPALNMLKNTFDAFAVGGIRFSFPLGSLYTYQNNKKIMELNRRELDADRETFLLNTRAALTKETNAINKYTKLLQQDSELIALRTQVTQSAMAQLENGVITTHEYITQLNAEHLARQLKNLHQVQLLNARITYQTISGY